MINPRKGKQLFGCVTINNLPGGHIHQNRFHNNHWDKIHRERKHEDRFLVLDIYRSLDIEGHMDLVLLSLSLVYRHRDNLQSKWTQLSKQLELISLLFIVK